ncbi:MAG: hypothetical protein F6K26_49830 [Moorea sp. SIO2I5]|nr:hypothetical protein [Moorena sp. SIO2I5]
MQSASGGNHGKARVGGTPKTALPPQDRAASLHSPSVQRCEHSQEDCTQ